MIIQQTHPLEIPASAAKVFPHVWLYSILVNAPSASAGSVLIETLPCNMESGEIAGGEYMTPIKTDDLWRAVAEVPEVAAAMQSIFQAVEPLRDWIEAQQPSE